MICLLAFMLGLLTGAVVAFLIAAAAVADE